MRYEVSEPTVTGVRSGAQLCGYVTATLATFFIDSPSERLRQPDAENDEAELAGAKSIQALQVEITALGSEI